MVWTFVVCEKSFSAHISIKDHKNTESQETKQQTHTQFVITSAWLWYSPCPIAAHKKNGTFQRNESMFVLRLFSSIMFNDYDDAFYIFTWLMVSAQRHRSMLLVFFSSSFKYKLIEV